MFSPRLGIFVCLALGLATVASPTPSALGPEAAVSSVDESSYSNDSPQASRPSVPPTPDAPEPEATIDNTDESSYYPGPVSYTSESHDGHGANEHAPYDTPYPFYPYWPTYRYRGHYKTPPRPEARDAEEATALDEAKYCAKYDKYYKYCQGIIDEDNINGHYGNAGEAEKPAPVHNGDHDEGYYVRV